MHTHSQVLHVFGLYATKKTVLKFTNIGDEEGNDRTCCAEGIAEYWFDQLRNIAEAVDTVAAWVVACSQ